MCNRNEVREDVWTKHMTAGCSGLWGWLLTKPPTAWFLHLSHALSAKPANTELRVPQDSAGDKPYRWIWRAQKGLWPFSLSDCCFHSVSSSDSPALQGLPCSGADLRRHSKLQQALQCWNPQPSLSSPEGSDSQTWRQTPAAHSARYPTKSQKESLPWGMYFSLLLLLLLK